MQNNDTYILTQKGRDQGEVLVVLYRANRFVSVEELITLSRQDRNTVLRFLEFFEQDGTIERLADDEKWGMVPDVRAVLEEMLLKNGWSV